MIYKENIYKSLNCNPLLESYKDSLSKNEQIHLKMFSFLNEKELLKELVNIRKIQRFMYCVGLKFGVSCTGPQEGFLEVNIKLLEIAKKSLIHKLNEVKFNGDYSSIG